MNWNPLFADRTQRMRRSAVRELLRLTTRPGMISFAGGLPAPELFPVQAVAEATNRLLATRGAAILQYGETEGVAELRDWVASSLSHSGVSLGRENVLITTGSQQGLDLLGRVLLDEGDSVAVENPTYLAALSAWRPLGVRFLPLETDDEGLRPDAIAELPRSQPKVTYVIPNFQNPSGVTLSLPRRRALVTAARETPTLLIEDDPYGELRYSGSKLPSLLELAGGVSAGVVRLGSFSKILSPGLRVGYVVADAPLIERLALAKQAMDLHTATFNQWLVWELLTSSVLTEHLPILCSAYRQRRDAMLGALRAHLTGAATWTKPDGGMFIFARLNEGSSAADLLAKAVERGVAFVPGAEFHVDGSGANTLRLNFSHANPERIMTGIARVAEALGS